MKKTIHWIARVCAATSIAILLLFVSSAFQDMRQPPSLTELVGLAFFPVGVLLGLLLGFWQPVIGGSVAMMSLLAFYSWHVVVAGGFPSGPYFVWFAFPGLLFLAAGWLASRNRSVAL